MYDFTASATVTKGKRVNCATKRTTIAEYQQGAKVYGVIYKHRKNGETVSNLYEVIWLLLLLLLTYHYHIDR